MTRSCFLGFLVVLLALTGCGTPSEPPQAVSYQVAVSAPARDWFLYRCSARAWLGSTSDTVDLAAGQSDTLQLTAPQAGHYALRWSLAWAGQQQPDSWPLDGPPWVDSAVVAAPGRQTLNCP